MIDRVNKKVCFICGAGHSGSTLLGFVLGSHSDAFYGGELSNTELFGNPDTPERKRVCKFCGKDCSVWNNFNPDANTDIYEQLSVTTGKPVIIDSDKNIHWLKKQTRLLENMAVKMYLIFLKRDGRAVVNSYLRKQSSRPAEVVIYEWMQQISETRLIYNNFSGEKKIVHYEEFTEAPEQLAGSICEFMSIRYDKRMLQYHLHAHHPVGGNVGTQYTIANTKFPDMENPYLRLSGKNMYYKNHPAQIVPDLRWKHELPKEVEVLFNRMTKHEQ